MFGISRQPMHGIRIMTRIKLATATALVALAAAGVATGVQAADLILEPRDDAFVDVTDPSFYALLYGGVAFPSTAVWTNDDEEYDLSHGYALGGAIGVGIVEGLSVELDVFHTGNRHDIDDPDYVLSTLSVMGNIKGTLPLNEVFDVYGGAGVGGIHLRYDYGGDIYTGWGAGYQFMIGASFNVTENIAIFGELRHQNSFSAIDVVDQDDDERTLSVPTNAALVGIKLSM
jgi:opacity protein-like surface antigen